ncbi:MAG TPA: uracil-DNA glycosylase family protein [Steroidobacteraceae bacterium]|nr:uracil-DNA glycosylase family protein [Steroidobacteraceae bacterium]
MRDATFAAKVLHFYARLRAPRVLPEGVEIMNPHRDRRVRSYVEKFFLKFYGDTAPRILVFGINPGRFGAGRTGVMFTDPVALELDCGIQNHLEKRREMSSEFIYDFIGHCGGARDFYGRFFLTAVSPLGFVRNGLNFNYYDDPRLLRRLRPFILRTMREQLAFGACRDAAIVLGTGDNYRFLSALNEEYRFFGKLLPLDHPRFIMQYRRRRLAEYRSKYLEVFAAAADIQ